MLEISLDRLKEYRSDTFNIRTGHRLASADEAVSFVVQRGFIFFWPVKGMECPSLWVAAAGDRPVPDEHDDPGHVTWGWKDSMLGLRRWYYARCLFKRNAMISLNLLPSFYALSPNFGDPENDYLQEYYQGTMRLETKLVYEALLHEGRLDTLALRRAARLSSPESEGRFNRALDDLQMSFRILPVGISEVGAWHYAFIYDLVHRHYPDLINQSQAVTEMAARQALSLVYIRNIGAAQQSSIQRLFRWRTEDVHRTLDALVKAGEILIGMTRPDRPGDWLCLPGLVK